VVFQSQASCVALVSSGTGMQNLWWRRLKAHLPAFGSVGTARAVVKNVRRRKTAFVVVDGIARYSWSSCAIFWGRVSDEGN
jgi:hypothetical protein